MRPFEETPAEQTDMWAQLDAFWATPWGLFLSNVIQVALIVVIALIIRWVLHFVIRRTVNQIVSGVKRKQDVTDTQALSASPLAAVRLVQRTRTLGSVLTNIVNVTLFVVVLLMIVGTLAPDVLGSFTLLSAAVGAGLGFGAQNIVKDALNGLFMVVEDQLGVGDIVDLGFATGIVEEVRIRVTSVRDVNGTLWFVRNGEILRVGNMSQGWARVIVDLAVPYDADIDEVEATLLRTATEMAQSGKWRSRILEKPEVWGLESISADAMVIRVVMKVRTSSKDDVARELRVRLKRALDEMGLKLPSLASVVLTGFDGVTRVKGAKPPKTAPNPVLDRQPPTKRSLRAKRAAESVTGAGSVPSDPAPTTTVTKPAKAAKTPKTADDASAADPKDAP
ncbi:mechanosensitive ion channel family protein [Agromyces aurantiacus]|uniref:Mechanosensitive ion channel family protein n=1 Tax=Agromyces aurantiacus TaxID=165814 RepID=A0ABV9R7K7_9MICO|nr:small conductance mechanosensitive channel [Agromyces aurantiacus]